MVLGTHENGSSSAGAAGFLQDAGTGTDRPTAGLAFLIERLSGLGDLAVAGTGSPLLLPVTIHDLQGRLLHATGTAARLLGIAGNTSGPALMEAIHLQDRVHFAHTLGNAAANTNGPIELRLNPCLPAGKERNWVEMELSRVVVPAGGTPAGEETFILANWRDISRRHRIERELREASEKAEESNVAKTRFFANVSHELRTPLNAILGFSELLNSPIGETIGPAKRIEYISLIHESASHLLSLLNAILDMSKIETGMYEIFPEAFDLADCVENTVAMMKGQAEIRQVELRCADFTSLPEIVADKRAIRQILINLVSNAIKFSNEQGIVNISASRTARMVSISVEDHGIGISPENIERLGTPFFQADSKYDRKYEGTGIGLSVVKGLIELHEGSLTVESARGEGTRMTITLPISLPRGRGVPGSDMPEKISTRGPSAISAKPGERTTAVSSLSGAAAPAVRHTA